MLIYSQGEIKTKMFRKLVANLPFSSAMAENLGPHAREVHKEQVKRGHGIILLVLLLAVQSFILFDPIEVGSAPSTPVAQQNFGSSIVTSKRVRNFTQGVEDANGLKAEPGDRLEFIVNTRNSGDSLNITVTDNLSDILEYSTLIDAGGGQFDELSKSLSWGQLTIDKGATDVRKFIVEVHDKINSSPSLANNPNSYDCVLSNTYGNTVGVKVDCPLTKKVELFIDGLPSIGLLGNLLLSIGFSLMATFLYLRSRQISKELNILKREYS